MIFRNVPWLVPVFISVMLFQLGGGVAGAEPVTMTIKAEPGLRYDTLRFQVSPGQTVNVSLVNVDEMAHNLVFTESGERLSVVKAAEKMAGRAGAKGYIPDVPQVLAAIPVIDGGEEESVTFQAPETSGVYPYVCTFPGHGYTMYGAMYVGVQELPALAEDPNVPGEHVKDDAQTKKKGEGLNLPHAYTARRPFMYRIKMPDATQASIAVALENGQNYCWDAGRHRLRYAWKGGFVDPMPNFSGKGHEPAEIKGKIYYRSRTFPLRIGNPDQVPDHLDFNGYRMIDGKPAFEVSMDGVQVQHYITTAQQGNGIVRKFHVRGAQEPIWFVTDPEGNVEFSSPDGTFDERGRMKLSPRKARSFRVRVVPSSSGGE